MDATVNEAAAAHTRGPFPCIDGVRAIAALAVIAFHSVVTSDPTLRTAGVRWLIHLNIGVWVFFVISGFLLYLPFARHHLSGRPRSSVQDYAIRRVARIYPAYWVALAFWLFVLPRTNIGGAGGPLAYITLTQGYFTTDISRGIPVAWSLVTEVSFYAFLPVYAVAVGWLARRARSPLPVELAGIGLLVVVGIGSLATLHRWTTVPPWITVLPVRLHVFAFGMLLAVVVATPWRPQWRTTLERIGRRSWVWWVLAALVYLAIPFVIASAAGTPPTRAQAVAGDLCRALVALFLVIPVVLGPQQAVEPGSGVIRRVLRSRVLVFLGLVSYGLYLWHYFIVVMLRTEWLPDAWHPANWVVLFLTALPPTVLAATASWYVVERPVQRASRRLTRSGQVVASPAAPADAGAVAAPGSNR